MNIIFAAILTVLMVEWFLLLPFKKHLKGLLAIINKSSKIVASNRISDHWKETVLLSYAQTLFKECLWLFFMLLGLILLVVIIAFLIDEYAPSGLEMLVVLSTPLNWIWMTVIALIYVHLRKKANKNVT